MNKSWDSFSFRKLQKSLPKWRAQSHKTQHGRVMVVAGSENSWGAGLLAARAAYRMGAGYVTWVSQKNPAKVVAKIPEVMTAQYGDRKIWSYQDASFVVGPGLGVSSFTLRVLKDLKKHKIERVVVDADALTVLAKNLDLLPLPQTWILTPHMGEAVRLLGVNEKKLSPDRKKILERLQSQYQCVILLKGPRTLVSDASQGFINKTGNAALAKAGTGDVLAGMIAALLAQKVSSLKAAAIAAYIHGLVADTWVKTKSQRSLMASDIPELLPKILKQF